MPAVTCKYCGGSSSGSSNFSSSRSSLPCSRRHSQPSYPAGRQGVAGGPRDTAGGQPGAGRPSRQPQTQPQPRARPHTHIAVRFKKIIVESGKKADPLRSPYVIDIGLGECVSFCQAKTTHRPTQPPPNSSSTQP